MSNAERIYDWNTVKPAYAPPNRRVYLHDETLRDGLQSPSVTEPSAEKKIEILHLMEALGIDTLNIGLPGAGGGHLAGIKRLAKEIASQKMRIRPYCSARTVLQDIDPIAEISQSAGIPIETCTFIGSSFIRFYAEGWTLEQGLRKTGEAVTYAVQLGMPVTFITEDTTRADPNTLRALYTEAIRCGARGVCVCDTVGHSTPDGARAVVSFVKSIIEEQGEPVRLDWHGHQDRGLGLINSIAALEAGADQVHGAALGMGERVGNTPMDQLLVNFKLLGWIDNDLSRLGEYCDVAAAACRWDVPCNYPVFGRDAFRTATGVHAAAVVKCFEKGDSAAADMVYSGVPAGWFGRGQVIEIGGMSGKWNVIHWLKTRGIEATDERVGRILDYAKSCSSVLTEDEIMTLVLAPSAVGAS